MAAFELNPSRGGPAGEDLLDSRRLREEPIIAHKIYDSCRAQDCLTHTELGPARTQSSIFIDTENLGAGEVIVPPSNSVSVDISELVLSGITVANKRANPFKKGFWDIDIRYVFEYLLSFRDADGNLIGNAIPATSAFIKKLTLFGSNSSEHLIGTDLPYLSGVVLNSEPYVWAEGKAIALAAEIRYGRSEKPRKPLEVAVTVGLFSITQIFRIVNLRVESRGFNIPRECEGSCPTNPCDFFDALDFPMDIFAPPQREEFKTGQSANIPKIAMAAAEA